MRISYPFLALFLCLQMSAVAQRSVEVGFSSGITNFYGDLGHDDWFQVNSTQPGVAVTFRNFLKPGAYSGNFYRPVSAEFRLSWHRLQLDEVLPFGGREGFELRNYGRGIGFRNDLFGASGHITYTYYSNPRVPLYMQPPAFFAFTGIGLFYGTPKADLFNGSISMENRYHYWPDGTIRDVAYQGPGSVGNVIEKDGEFETDLTDWYTEGGSGAGAGEGKLSKQGKKTNVAVPVGMGFRYGINKQLTLSMEFGYYMFFSDFIDDVSDRYPTQSEIASSYPGNTALQELALYISDPSGLGRGNASGVGMSPRGNPSSKDAHSFIGLELAYKFDFRKGVQRLWGAK